MTSDATRPTPGAAAHAWVRRLGRWLLPLTFGFVHLLAVAAPPRDRLTLLVPDGANRSAWQISAWVDAAADEGIKLEILSDSEFLLMGDNSVANIAGLIMPDSAHIRASDAVVNAVKRYATLGGRLMLVFDAGALDANGFYPITGPSRFADAVGVQYGDFNLLRDRLVGFGPVVGTRARLDALSLPPGKYLPYTTAPASVAYASASAAFVPTSQYDPGGTEAMTGLIRARAKKGIDDGSRNVRDRRPYVLRELLGLGAEDTSGLRLAGRHADATNAVAKHIYDVRGRPVGYVDAILAADAKSYTERATATPVPDDSRLNVISGYAFGPLNYFSFVTTGEFPGTVFLSSPEHGLVAGQRSLGSGQLLFVNIPLGSFKANGTDSAPIQGFLGLFAREVAGVATMSVQPQGRGGLIFNIHVDDGDDLNTNVKNLLSLKKVGNPWSVGPFSVHFTAGPDVISFGDGNGMDLANNKKSKDLVKKLSKLKIKFKPSNDTNTDTVDDVEYYSDDEPDNKPGESRHEIGSHGGWIHDYWGANATVLGPALTHLLQLNFDAIEAVTGRKIREYSSPVGNTPTWAVNWLENRGVVAMYLVGDVGAAMVRSYRDGARLTNKLWSSPVTPLGKYATWEEFEEFGIGDAASGQWLVDLQSFVVNRRTNRMFYSHPPGVSSHLNPVRVLQNRGNSLQTQSRFAWYTMSQLADFSQRRIEVNWSAAPAGSSTVYSARHPSGLNDMTWLLPKARFNQPVITQGKGAVSADQVNWVVSVIEGLEFQFAATDR